MFKKIDKNQVLVSAIGGQRPVLDDLKTTGIAVNAVSGKLFYLNGDDEVTEKTLTEDEVKVLIGVSKELTGTITYRGFNSVNGTVVHMNDVGRTFIRNDRVRLPYGVFATVLFVIDDDTIVVDKYLAHSETIAGSIARSASHDSELAPQTELASLWSLALARRTIVPKPITKVIVLGASIMRGAFNGDNADKAVAQYRASGIEVEVFPEAIGGNTSADYLSRLPAIIETHRADASTTMFMLHGPGNDIREYPYNADIIEANMLLVCQMIKDAGFMLAMSTITYRLPSTGKISNVYNELIINPLIDEYADIRLEGWDLTFSNPDEYFSSDGVHGSSGGYDLLREGFIDTTIPYILPNFIPDITDPITDVPTSGIDERIGPYGGMITINMPEGSLGLADSANTSLVPVNPTAPLIDGKDVDLIFIQLGRAKVIDPYGNTVSLRYKEYPVYDSLGNHIDGATIVLRGQTDNQWMLNDSGRGDVDSGDTSQTVSNTVALSDSMYVSTDRQEQGCLDLRNLRIDPTAMYRVEVSASRDADDDRRVTLLSIGGGDIIEMDAASVLTDIVSVEVLGQDLMTYNIGFKPKVILKSSFGYLSAITIKKI